MRCVTFIIFLTCVCARQIETARNADNSFRAEMNRSESDKTVFPKPDAPDIRNATVGEDTQPPLNHLHDHTVLPPNIISKRCKGSCDYVGSVHKTQDTLEITRRDVNTDKMKKSCEICRESSLCKKYGKCDLCATYCQNTANPDEEPSLERHTPRESFIKGEELPREDPTLGLSADVAKKREGVSDMDDVYYSIGAFGAGPKQYLLNKLLNMRKDGNEQKLVVLAKPSSDDDKSFMRNLVVLDTAQVFGKEKEAKVDLKVHHIDADKIKKLDYDLISRLDDEINLAIQHKQKMLGDSVLTSEEVDKIIGHVLLNINRESQESSETAKKDVILGAKEYAAGTYPTNKAAPETERSESDNEHHQTVPKISDIVVPGLDITNYENDSTGEAEIDDDGIVLATHKIKNGKSKIATKDDSSNSEDSDETSENVIKTDSTTSHPSLDTISTLPTTSNDNTTTTDPKVGANWFQKQLSNVKNWVEESASSPASSAITRKTNDIAEELKNIENQLSNMENSVSANIERLESKISDAKNIVSSANPAYKESKEDNTPGHPLYEQHPRHQPVYKNGQWIYQKATPNKPPYTTKHTWDHLGMPIKDKHAHTDMHGSKPQTTEIKDEVQVNYSKPIQEVKSIPNYVYEQSKTALNDVVGCEDSEEFLESKPPSAIKNTAETAQLKPSDLKDHLVDSIQAGSENSAVEGHKHLPKKQEQTTTSTSSGKAVSEENSVESSSNAEKNVEEGDKIGCSKEDDETIFIHRPYGYRSSSKENEDDRTNDTSERYSNLETTSASIGKQKSSTLSVHSENPANPKQPDNLGCKKEEEESIIYNSYPYGYRAAEDGKEKELKTAGDLLRNESIRGSQQFPVPQEVTDQGSESNTLDESETKTPPITDLKKRILNKLQYKTSEKPKKPSPILKAENLIEKIKSKKLLKEKERENNLSSGIVGSIASTKTNQEEIPETEDVLNHFGKIIPSEETLIRKGGGLSDVYFVGNGIKLPLTMTKNLDGSYQLTVNLDKVCNCNEKVCKNVDSADENAGRTRNSEISKRSLSIKRVPRQNDSKQLNALKHEEVEHGSTDNPTDKIYAEYAKSKNEIREQNKNSSENGVTNKVKRINRNMKQYYGKRRKLDDNYGIRNKKYIIGNSEENVIDRRVGLVTDMLTWMKRIAMDTTKQG